MANSVGVRTAAGGVLSLEITPADVIDRCDRCRKTFREGDLFCDHLAALHGHPIAWLSDQPESAGPRPVPARHDRGGIVCAPAFLGPGGGPATPA